MLKNKKKFGIIKKLGRNQSGEIMNEKIRILDLEIDNCTAKYAMKKVVECMKTEPLNIIEMLTLNSIKKFQDETELKQQMKEFDLIFAGDKGLLEAAGIQDDRRLNEIESFLFIKMCMKFFHRNGTRVFILAEQESFLNEIKQHMEEEYPNIQIVETATMEEHGISDDMILNRINGAEADCILSALSSPRQEEFILRNRLLLNSRIWLGLGTELRELREGKTRFRKWKDLLTRYVLKKEIEDEKRGNA